MRFLEPYLRPANLTDSVRALYKGTLRVLLVLLHDYPEFLCQHFYQLCDAIPPSCIQLRNLILSAFPADMKLPDPFTPNLKIDALGSFEQYPYGAISPHVLLPDAALRAQLDANIPTSGADVPDA